MRRVAIPLEISEISAEIVPVVRRLFSPQDTDITLLAVAQPPEVPVVAGEMYVSTISPTVYTSALNREEWELYRKELTERLELQARHLRENGYRVSHVLLSGDIVDEIVSYVENGNFDVLAMATFGRRGLNRLVFGSIAESILRLVSVPMLLVRHQPDAEPESTLGTRLMQSVDHEQQFQIITATDGTKYSQQAVLLAAQVASVLNAGFKVLVTVRGQTGSTHGQQVMEATRELLRGHEPRPELVPIVGPADEVLSRYLDQNPADLLILGAFGDRGPGGAANIGLTVHRLVQYAPMPVLLVKGTTPTISRILVAIEVETEYILEEAVELAHTMGAQLQVLHVIPAPDAHPEQIGAGALPPDLVQGSPRASLLQNTLLILTEAGIGREALQVWRGDTTKTILKVADEGQHDVVVVGSREDSSRFAGSLGDSLVRFAPQSVLIMRPDPIQSES